MKKDEEILCVLRDASGKYISGEDLSARLGVSRAAIWKEIHALRGLGYEIDAQPNRGYRLIAVPDKLFADEISWKLGNKIIGRQIFSYDSLDSTNDVVFRMGKDGVKEGVVLFAEHQKNGRGRLGRTWTGPKGRSLLFSYLLRPNIAPDQIARITLVTAVSIARAVQRFTGKAPGIKWPNDIYFQNKKLCGILTEMSADADRVDFVVVGVGLNVNSLPSELPPQSISLRDILGREVSRIDFVRQLLKSAEEDYLRLKAGRFDKIASEWEEFSITTGRRVSVALIDRKIEGEAAGIDADGALWIRKDNGLQERVLSGIVQHLRI